ncbi:MAG: hypothetical protein H0U28_08595 [Nocardioidaceae bacterium]|nr:hypothetical protein [Nocardioidaceae bacterium]
MSRSLWLVPLLIAPALAPVAVGCGNGAAEVAVSPPIEVSGQTQQQRISLGGAELTVEVPIGLGPPRDDSLTGTECPTTRATFGTLPSGSTDHDPKLFFGTTSRACPDERRPTEPAIPLNGSFPTWASVADLPPDRDELAVDGPLEAAYRFSLPYTQCTNECYERTYDVVFVTLVGSDSTFWVQSTGLDADAVDAILDSLRVG